MTTKSPSLTVKDFKIYKAFLDPTRQKTIVEDLRKVATVAKPFSPQTPYGKPMSVRMTSAGDLGWFSDRTGYRYEPRHPSGNPWPDIPESVMDIWQSVANSDRQPDSCLINYYGKDAKMGLHQDRDEADLSWPVVSVSLGDDALFRMGGSKRKDPTDTIWLSSGDVVVMSGPARLAYHGIDRIRFGSSQLLPKMGRINITLRVAGDSD